MGNDQIYRQVAGHLEKQEFPAAKTLLNKHLASQPDDEIAHSLYGTILLRSGDQKEAIERFQANAAKFPMSFGAYADLAFTAQKLGELGLAKASFEKAVELNPSFYQGWVLLAQVAYRLSDFALAQKADSESEKFDPLEADYPKIQAAMRADNKGEAENIARSMLKRQPGHPRAAYVLAHLASTLGAHEARADILQHGIDHHPANQMLRRSKVEAYEAIGRYEDAVQEAKALVKLAPNYFSYWVLSRVQGHLGYTEEALACAEKAREYLEEDSDEQGKLDLLRGHALKIMGRRAESEEAYRACIKNTPNNGAGWWGLADLKNYRFSDTDLVAMRAILNDNTLDMDQRCQAGFALAKSFENNGNSEEAFNLYRRANDMRKGTAFNREQHRALFERIKVNYSADMLEVQANLEADVTPIFILGMPRAGSTLIEQILASHSQVEGTMELMTLPFLERRIRIELGQKHKTDYPESAVRLTAEECRKYGESYLAETQVFRTGKPYFIDKLPPNFERIGLIHKILPQAIIIDARRHPMDCCYSAYKQHFAGGHDYSYELENLGAYYNEYLGLMDHWDTMLPGKVTLVQYEDMVRDTETTVRGLLDSIGLPFEESCLRFFENKRAVRTASSEQVRQPINTKGLKPWADIEAKIEPLKKALGEATLTRFA